MSNVVKSALLDAMKERLRDLENTKLIGPDDINVLYQKQVLRGKIAELERDDPAA